MKAKLYGALVTVLLSGLCIGFFLGQYYDRSRMHRLMQRGPGRIEMMITDRLVHHLDLNGAQEQAVRAKVALAVRQADEELRQRGDVMKARMTALLVEIRPILSAPQQDILDRMDVDELRPRPPPPEGGRPPPREGQRPLPPPGDHDQP
jgi:hypothetical protein